MNLTQGLPMESYRLIGECSGKPYPVESHIMFICLPTLSKEEDESGELARFLLGLEPSPKSKNVKEISEQYKEVFKNFKADREVKEMFSVMEEREWSAEMRGREEGRVEGREEGRGEGEIMGMVKILIKELNYTPNQIAEKIQISVAEVDQIIAILKEEGKIL